MPQRPRQDDRGRARPNEVNIRARAEELAARGMPIQMALAVAGGKLSLNDALQSMARRAEVDRLMQKHDLSRALATQVALGQASIDAVMARRRLQEHRETYRTRSVLEEVRESGAPLTLLLHGHRRVSGKVLEVDSYMIRFQPLAQGGEGEPEGDVEEIHKLQVKLAFSPEGYKRVRKVMKHDKVLEQTPLSPIPRPQDRYTCSDRRLFRYLDEKVEIQITTLEGEQLRGQVAWFGRYEFGLKLKGDAEVVVFRHALHDLREG